MRIAIVTNIRSPYRKLQIEEFAKDSKLEITVYYTDRDYIGRKWKVDKIIGAKEVFLKGLEISKVYGRINWGLVNIVKNNDLIMIGGYEKPTYIMISLIARFLKKPYTIIFDGISPKKIDKKENSFKYALKNLVIQSANSIFTNGISGKEYFKKKFEIKDSQIFNQYLTVDIDKINSLYKNSENYKTGLRNKYNIHPDKIVLLYSGRLISRKNVEDIIMAIKLIKFNKEIELLILGDGPERDYLTQVAIENKVDLKITGFIENQEDLFKHYFIGDLLILPSTDEPWGLVINEAMAAGLPVITSDECGCSYDLVHNGVNGYVFPVRNVELLSKRIEDILLDNDFLKYGEKSREIISKWTFKESRKSLMCILKNL
jgi:glycosyltransferase involved in cell wall biosynthesis